ncbi:MAG: TetR/AcrR family transcriptional regulator [Betaproteobacteria bacterium]|nr:TetR/AcrR family transcriptional regulator [Betaproteobacteria bacterium]
MTTTRDRILDTAHELVLTRGFAATSLDYLVERAGITKGAFFHYFKSKADLAEALVERFAAQDLKLLFDSFGQAERMTADPLQQVFIVLGIFQKLFEGQEGTPSGCLFASYCYQSELLTEKNLRVINGNFALWRQAFADRYQRAAALYPAMAGADLEGLADMATVMFEGAYVMAKSQQDPKVLVRQLLHYRRYVELVFGQRPAAASVH